LACLGITELFKEAWGWMSRACCPRTGAPYVYDARMMSDARKLRIEPGKVFTAACACCASETRTLSGFVDSGDAAFGAYFVTGTVGRPEHDASFDLILGSFGDAARGDRRGVSVVFRSPPDSSQT